MGDKHVLLDLITNHGVRGFQPHFGVEFSISILRAMVVVAGNPDDAESAMSVRVTGTGRPPPNGTAGPIDASPNPTPSLAKIPRRLRRVNMLLLTADCAVRPMGSALSHHCHLASSTPGMEKEEKGVVGKQLMLGHLISLDSSICSGDLGLSLPSSSPFEAIANIHLLGWCLGEPVLRSCLDSRRQRDFPLGLMAVLGNAAMAPPFFSLEFSRDRGSRLSRLK